MARSASSEMIYDDARDILLSSSLAAAKAKSTDKSTICADIIGKFVANFFKSCSDLNMIVFAGSSTSVFSKIFFYVY